MLMASKDTPMVIKVPMNAVDATRNHRSDPSCLFMASKRTVIFSCICSKRLSIASKWAVLLFSIASKRMFIFCCICSKRFSIASKWAVLLFSIASKRILLFFSSCTTCAATCSIRWLSLSIPLRSFLCSRYALLGTTLRFAAWWDHPWTFCKRHRWQSQRCLQNDCVILGVHPCTPALSDRFLWLACYGIHQI